LLSQNWASWAGEASSLSDLLAKDLGLDTSDSSGVARIAELRQQYIDAAEEQERLEREKHELAVRNYEESIRYARQLAGLTSNLKTGDLSPLKGLGKLNEASSRFSSLSAAAAAGDSDALSQIGGAAETYLSVARDYYASSQPYTDIFDEVTGRLGSLGVSSAGARPGAFSSSAGDVLRGQLEGLNDELQALRETFVDQGRSSFLDLANAAAGGDESALAELSTVAETYLGIARDVFGDSDEYAGIFENVATKLDTVAENIGDVANPGEYVAAANEQLTNKLNSLAVQLQGIQDEIADEAVAHLVSIDQSLINLPESLRAVLGDVSMGEAGRVWEQLIDSGMASTSVADAIAADPELFRQVNAYLSATGQGSVSDYMSANNPMASNADILQAWSDFSEVPGTFEDQARAFLSAAIEHGVGSTQIANAWNEANPDYQYTSQDINTLAQSLGLPTFAGGGIATSPSIFGEAGPEAAVPLEDGAIPVRIYGSESQLIQKFDEWAVVWERIHGQLVNIEESIHLSGENIVEAVTGNAVAVTETIEREQQIARRTV